MADYQLKYTGEKIDEALGKALSALQKAPVTSVNGKVGDVVIDNLIGNDGVGIDSVTQTTTSTDDGGDNVITVKLSNGETHTFTVKNGHKGSTGEKGEKGDKGDTGEQGEKGDKGDKGDTGATGADGIDGTDGVGIVLLTTTKSADDNGYNYITFSLSDGSSKQFSVKNGSKGETGAPGGDGVGITAIKITEV